MVLLILSVYLLQRYPEGVARKRSRNMRFLKLRRLGKPESKAKYKLISKFSLIKGARIIPLDTILLAFRKPKKTPGTILLISSFSIGLICHFKYRIQ